MSASLNPALGSVLSRRAGARGTTEVRVRAPHRAAAAAGRDRLTHQSEDPAGFSSYFLTRARIAVRRLRTSGRPPASERAEQVVPRSRFPRMVPLSGVASTAGWPGPPLHDVVFREGRRLATGVEHASCPPEQLSGATEPLELGCRCGLQPPITSCVSPPLWAPVEIGLLLVEEVEEGGECTDRERRGKVGCELEEKERFWSELDEVMESIPTGERVVIGADFNGHVGERNTGDEQVMGKFGVKERNLEGQMVVDFAKRMDMAVVNTYFQKREEHRVTYKSGDLEKAYDRVPREELWYCMRKSGVAEKYVRVVQDMYERSRTVVRCAVGQTEEFKVEVGLHQGSALSPFLFAIVMDQLSEEVRQESPWTIMFADDIVICSESREQVEENLER
ncbi:hypothetical protein QTP70_003513 [Hemibagrus guttatus]|uniref:Reverse transcriptase domain-containing protein n=1 Tax=Hemibagrus guttatus TaxID=175788 RepID=A0AAE0REG5_9TELE|nr:hypothetical protein QTP70_003513 [Hemibagrus guttatus]